jgi:hypothetical protein
VQLQFIRGWKFTIRHLERRRDRAHGKQTFPLAQSYRIDHQPEIIDQIMLHKRLEQITASPNVQIGALPLLEFGDFLRNIPGEKSGRLRPAALPYAIGLVSLGDQPIKFAKPVQLTTALGAWHRESRSPSGRLLSGAKSALTASRQLDTTT